MAANILFSELEGCDLHPAAAVAVAGLRQAVASGKMGKKDTILLNITGGGIEKLERAGRKRTLEPDIIFSQKAMSTEDISARLKDFRKARIQ
jgi:cysteate synthase